MSSNAVAVRPEQQVPSDDEIAGIKRAGQALVAHQKEVAAIARQLEGLKWGNVSGSALSVQTRNMVAEFCRVTRANALVHLEILGGRPYLTVKYWEDMVTSHPLYHHYEQREIGEEAEKQLRAAGLVEDANAMLRERIQWNPPAAMKSVVVTDIYRFSNQAPMEGIRAGKIDPTPYLIKISECNWAGGKNNDPVGTANPSLTARSRSFRRAAVKGFPAWTQQYDQQIAKAEAIIEAEFEVIEAAELSRLPSGPQAVGTADGEPSRASAEGARPLPVEGEAPKAEPQQRPAAQPSPQPPVEEFDRDDARKKIMATLRDAGIKDRKEWARANGLPESTAEWTREQYVRAWHLLVDPAKERVLAKLADQDLNLEDVALQVIGQAKPDFLKHWLAIEKHLDEGDL